mgnify:CR=1 FL=1
MKLILKLFKGIFFTLFVVLCVFNIVLFFSTSVLKNSYPNILGYTYFEVLTGSMRDEIKERDIVIIKLNSNYNVGDVVTYKTAKSYVTHRIIKIEGNKVITKGDANNTEDEPISKEQIIGKVIKVVGSAGIFMRVFTDKVVVVLLFIVVLVLSYILSLLEREE